MSEKSKQILDDSTEKIVSLNVDIPKYIKDQLKFRSYSDGKTLKQIVEEALKDYLSKG